ncbi:hypothetical protein QCD79_33145, partial [Pseudomonas quasicaspiana]|nr:hypothetical protein [Pseudomonas quasicaspiana]
AAAAPDQDFIGVEVHYPGVGALLNGVLTQGLTNVRVFDRVAIVDPHVGQALSQHAVKQRANTWVMHFNADEVL